jgi:hypothetical protein
VGSIAKWITEIFHYLTFPVALWSLGRLSLWQICVPRRLPGGWSRTAPWADNLATFMWRLRRNPGSLYLLKPTGPVYTDLHTFTNNHIHMFKQFWYFVCTWNTLFKTHHFTKKKKSNLFYILCIMRNVPLIFSKVQIRKNEKRGWIWGSNYYYCSEEEIKERTLIKWAYSACVVPYHVTTGIVSLSTVLMIRSDFRQFVTTHFNRTDSNIRVECSLFYAAHCLFLSAFN